MELATELKTEFTLKLIDQLSSLADQQRLADSVKKSYLSWILKYLHFYTGQDPALLGKQDAEKFLSCLALEHHCDCQTQQLAKEAIIFLYQQFLKITLGDLHYLRLKQRRGFFSRFGETHCAAVVSKLSGQSQLIAKLAVATHLKLREVINLRLADINIKKSQILVRKSDQSINYVTHIPVQMILELRIQVMKVNHLVNQDLLLNNNVVEAQSPFLFPYRHAGKFQSFGETTKYHFQATPISLLKNDIQLAIKNYLRLQPDSNHASAPIRIHEIRPSKRQMHFERRLFALRNNQHSLQKSFDFIDELGAA